MPAQPVGARSGATGARRITVAAVAIAVLGGLGGLAAGISPAWSRSGQLAPQGSQGFSPRAIVRHGRTVDIDIVLASQALIADPPAASALTVSGGPARSRPSVRRLPDSALEVAVVIDPTKGGIDLPVVQAAVAQLADRLPRESKVAIVDAGDRPRVVAPMATTAAAISAVGQVRESPGRSTMVAFNLALDQFSPGPATRRAIVFFGSGYKGTAGAERRVAARFEKLSITAYPILLDKALIGSVAPDFPFKLQGGRGFRALSVQLPETVETIASELGARYRVTVRLSPRGLPASVVLRLRTPSTTGRLSVVMPPGDAVSSSKAPGIPFTQLLASLLVFCGLVALLVMPVRRAAARAAARRDEPPPLPMPTAVGSRELGPGAPAPTGLVAGAPPDHLEQLLSTGRAGALPGELTEGPAAVEELLRVGNRQVHGVWVADGTEVPAALELARAARVPVRVVRPDVIAAASRSGLARGVVASAAPLAELDIGELSSDEGEALTVLALLGDWAPAELAALLRDAVTRGVTGLMVVRSRHSLLTPQVVALAEGAVEHVQVVTVADPALALARMRALGVFVIGIDGSTPSRLADVREDLTTSPVALVLASGEQLDRRVLANCDVVAAPALSLGAPGAGAFVGSRSDASVVGRMACGELLQSRRSVVDA